MAHCQLFFVTQPASAADTSGQKEQRRAQRRDALSCRTLSCQASDAHRRHSVFPVPVGLSRIAFSPCRAAPCWRQHLGRAGKLGHTFFRAMITFSMYLPCFQIPNQQSRAKYVRILMLGAPDSRMQCTGTPQKRHQKCILAWGPSVFEWTPEPSTEPESMQEYINRPAMFYTIKPIILLFI